MGDFSQLAYFVDEYPYASIYSAPMQDTIQRQILNALLIALRPIARALLRAGAGHREFNEISKAAFVDVATKDYGLRGRPTNVSRVAVMTGLTRKEVRRLRDKSEAGEETVVIRSTPMSEILHRWYTESDYLMSDNRPKDLPFDGLGNSFSSLVTKFGGDIPPGAMRTELKRIAAIEELSSGDLKVLKRNVSNLADNDRLISILALQIHAAAITGCHNSDPENRNKAWIQRLVHSNRVRGSDRSRVKRITSDRLAEFAESIDDLFAAYETLYDEESTDAGHSSIGIGVFYFEDDGKESNAFMHGKQ
ncbi:MAG: hypothetical protein HOM16_10240 [Woeseia sp.]|nr:hypothetical protein [Woeseia sp.]